jgi:hypothetical protein
MMNIPGTQVPITALRTTSRKKSTGPLPPLGALLILPVLLFSVAAYFGYLDFKMTETNAQGEANRYSEKTTFISAKSCLATTAQRTFTLNSGKLSDGGWGLATLNFKYTYSAATAVTMVCTISDDSGTTSFTPQSCNDISGTNTCVNMKWSKAVTASANWPWRVGLGGFVYATCTVYCVSGSVGDSLTVTGYYSTR